MIGTAELRQHAYFLAHCIPEVYILNSPDALFRLVFTSNFENLPICCIVKLEDVCPSVRMGNGSSQSLMHP